MLRGRSTTGRCRGNSPRILRLGRWRRRTRATATIVDPDGSAPACQQPDLPALEVRWFVRAAAERRLLGHLRYCRRDVRPVFLRALPPSAGAGGADGCIRERSSPRRRSPRLRRTGSSTACSLVASGTDRQARFFLQPLAAGSLDLDFVSLFPRKTFKNRPNGCRADLAQLLADLKPGVRAFSRRLCRRGRHDGQPRAMEEDHRPRP